MFVEVVVKSFLLSRAENIFTYKVLTKDEKNIKLGKRVLVPFGKSNKLSIALIINILEKEKVDNINIKSIYKILDDFPIVSEDNIKLSKFMSDKYITNLSYCLNLVLPPGDWSKVYEYFILNKDKSSTLNEDELSFFSVKRDLIETKTFLNEERLTFLLENEILLKKIKYNDSEKKFIKVFIKLNDSFDFSKIRKSAVKQNYLINFLKNKDYVILDDILKIVTKNTVDNLISKGALFVKKKKIYNDFLENVDKYKKLKLNQEQQEAVDTILNSKGDKFLIHGVTGSGKTEVFLHLVEQMLKMNKSSIILVPEISLTPQTIERFRGRFKDDIAIIHSKLTNLEKLNQWKQIQEKNIKIVIGARSAIFSPLKNLGLIIIDEEHESSYISDQSPRYVTREVAEKLISLTKSKLVLASATPSVVSYDLAKRGVYKLLELKNRATKNSLPEVSVVDMREELLLGNRSILSNELFNEINNALEKKEQVILFLNKRGRSSFVFCRSCGFVLKCDCCDISMTYHKDNKKDICICHMCGRTKKRPTICPSCFKKSIKEFGFGTEALEAYVKEKFKNATVYRMDADTSKEKNFFKDVYDKMKNKKIDILIGTQMISKGLDFPNVTLVGVILADISLNIPLFSSSEKTFQLLTQVAGRSGRGEKNGKVIIQTYKPTHYSIMTASSHDYKTFYEQEINFRKNFLYPPVANIVNFQFKSKNIDSCIEELKKIKDLIFENFEDEIKNNQIILFGPNPDAIKWVNMVYRYNLTVKILKDYEKFRKFLVKIIFDKKYSFNTEKKGKLILTLN